MMTPGAKKKLIAVAATVSVVAGGAFASATVLSSSAASGSIATDSSAMPTTTASVVSSPLTFVTRAPASIQFAGSRELRSELAGVLTGIPAPGTVVEPGQELFRVADQPVVLWRGDLPMWRDIEPGVTDGADVEQLKRNLADLGFFHGRVDRTYTWDAQRAVRAWQKSVGLPQDAVIPRGRVSFLPDAVRVGEHQVEVGADIGPGTVVYNASSSSPIVSATVPAADRDAAAIGADVTISLPGGGSTAGTVSEVGDPRSETDASGRSQVVVPVVITPSEVDAVLPQVSLPVQVTFTRRTDEPVLQVPISALLAVEPGTYAVDVVDGESVRRVPVQLGRFASGMVEIVGGDLREGAEVVTAG